MICTLLYLLFITSFTGCTIDNTEYTLDDTVAESPTVDETSYLSILLDRKAEYCVLLPGNYQKKKAAGHRFPVLYLLHCLGGNHYVYLESYHLTESIDTFDMIIAIPFDGTQAGWWLDSPADPSSRISTWLTVEFKLRIDSLYPTLPDRANTGIAGHSMGGFGAMYHLEKHPGIYCAGFSAKGLLDITGHSQEYLISTVLGDINVYPDRYHAVDLFENAFRLKGTGVCLMFYSGPIDWFGEENRRFDSLCTTLNIQHRYFENDESHPQMSQQSTLRMLSFFDSCFTR